MGAEGDRDHGAARACEDRTGDARCSALREPWMCSEATGSTPMEAAPQHASSRTARVSAGHCSTSCCSLLVWGEAGGAAPYLCRVMGRRRRRHGCRRLVSPQLHGTDAHGGVSANRTEMARVCILAHATAASSCVVTSLCLHASAAK